MTKLTVLLATLSIGINAMAFDQPPMARDFSNVVCKVRLWPQQPGGQEPVFKLVRDPAYQGIDNFHGWTIYQDVRYEVLLLPTGNGTATVGVVISDAKMNGTKIGNGAVRANFDMTLALSPTGQPQGKGVAYQKRSSGQMAAWAAYNLYCDHVQKHWP